MAAWQEVPSVCPVIRKVMAHRSKQNVACRSAVIQTILLGKKSHECLVDLCVRDERVVCHESVLEEPLQGLVVATGVLYCVRFQKGETLLGMPGHCRCAAGDETAPLSAHVATLASSSEVVASDSFRSIPFVSRQASSKDSALLTAAGLIILTRRLLGTSGGSSRDGSRGA